MAVYNVHDWILTRDVPNDAQVIKTSTDQDIVGGRVPLHLEDFAFVARQFDYAFVEV